MAEPATIITLTILCVLGILGVANFTKEEYRRYKETKFIYYKRRIIDRKDPWHTQLFDLLVENADKKKVQTTYRIESGERIIGDIAYFVERDDESFIPQGMWLFFDSSNGTIIMYCKDADSLGKFRELLEAKSKFKLVSVWIP